MRIVRQILISSLIFLAVCIAVGIVFYIANANLSFRSSIQDSPIDVLTENSIRSLDKSQLVAMEIFASDFSKSESVVVAASGVKRKLSPSENKALAMYILRLSITPLRPVGCDSETFFVESADSKGQIAFELFEDSDIIRIASSADERLNPIVGGYFLSEELSKFLRKGAEK